MTRVSSPTDRRPGFLNSAPTFDVRQRHSIRGGAVRILSDNAVISRAFDGQPEGLTRDDRPRQHHADLVDEYRALRSPSLSKAFLSLRGLGFRVSRGQGVDGFENLTDSLASKNDFST
jgi:hypothetical protein